MCDEFFLLLFESEIEHNEVDKLMQLFYKIKYGYFINMKVV